MNTLDALQRTRLSRFLRRLDRAICLTGSLLFSLMIVTPPQLALAQQTTTEIDLTPTDLTPIGELDLGDIDFSGSGTQPPIDVQSCYAALSLFDNNFSRASRTGRGSRPVPMPRLVFVQDRFEVLGRVVREGCHRPLKSRRPNLRSVS